jgi:hypothetical protein
MTMLKATLGGVMVELTRSLLPPGCREHVLGDLQERYRSPLGYLADAAGAVPAAIFGEILRVTPPPFILLEAILVYTSFFAAAVYSRAMGPFWMHATPSQLAAMTGLVMMGSLWRDSREQPPAWGAIRAVARLRCELRLRRTSFGFRLLIASLDARAYFINYSWMVCLLWQILFPTSHLFPGPITVFRGVMVALVLISPLRVWLRMRRRTRRFAT